jgi:hypothetical protein
MPAKTCCVCGRGARQGVELRPYGPQGAPICFRCARSTPELEAEAKAQLRKRLDGLEGSVIATPAGPAPAHACVQAFRCATCGAAPTPAEARAIVGTLERVSREFGGPPEVASFVCDTCSRSARKSPPVCVRCSQPIALEEGAIAAVDGDGRPCHAGTCPDWLGGLEAARGERRLADARATDEALEELERSPEAAALLAAIGGMNTRGSA